jgi:hypothetical protein
MTTTAGKMIKAKAAKEKRRMTLLEHAITEVGIIKGANALVDLLIWTVARERHGRPPTWEELREVGAYSVPATFRAQKRLREMYGGDKGITAVADLVVDQAGEHMRTLAKESPVPDVAVAMIGGLALPAGAG